MNGAAGDERQWWSFESDFDVARFGEYEFGERYCGPVVATVGQMSFSWRVALQPKGGRYNLAAGGMAEVRDRMGISIQLVDSPIFDVEDVELEDVRFNIKVYKADGSLGVNYSSPPETFKIDGGWLAADWLPNARSSLPMNAKQLRAYVRKGAEGSEYVRVRVELGIRKSAFDALAMLPLPTPRQDVNERLTRWYCGGRGVVKLVANDGTEFTVYKDLLTESSADLGGLRPRSDQRIHVGDKSDMCGEALGELVSHITFGSTRPSRVHRHVIELLDASVGYQLTDLKVVCERAMIEKMLAQKAPADFLEMLKAAEDYDLSVELNVGHCRLLKMFQQLSDADKDRFDSREFNHVCKAYMELSSQSQLALKR